MLFSTNKDKGNAGLANAIAYFGSNGYVVSIPLNDTQDYDLIVDNGKELKKIQVKSTNQISKYGIYTVNLRSMGGTHGVEYKRVGNTNVDLLFVFCGNKDMYLIPKIELKNQTSLNLGKDKDIFKIYI